MAQSNRLNVKKEQFLSIREKITGESNKERQNNCCVTGTESRRFVATKLEKLASLATMITYLVGGFWLSRAEIPILDRTWEKAIMLQSDGREGRLAKTLKWIIDDLFLGGDARNSATSRFWLAVIGTAIVHQVAYWILCLPWFLLQFARRMQREHKIQAHSSVSMRLQLKCFTYVMWNQCFIELPIMIGNYYFAQWIGYGWSYAELPTFYQSLGCMIGCLAAEDTWHYFLHGALHRYPILYMRIHKMHHEFSSPIAMQAEYAHPLEIFILAGGFAIGCCLYCRHFFSTWLWMLVRMTETIEVHSGYDCSIIYPFNIFRYLPYYGGPRFHDFHHQNFIGNYASTFTCWDQIFDTICYYKKFISSTTTGGKVEVNYTSPLPLQSEPKNS